MCITGLRAIEEHLKQPDIRGELYISGKGKRLEALVSSARKKGLPVHHRDKEEVVKITGARDYKGIALVLPDTAFSEDLSLSSVLLTLEAEDPLILLLDGITDPQNLGAILRSADQFGVDCVILPRRRGAGITDTVARVSSGAVEYVKVVKVPNLAGAMETLKNRGFWVYGAAMGGTPLRSVKLKGKVAVVMGSEGSGLSHLVRERCDGIVSIPTRGHVDSLNVSVAAGIILYEIRCRQGS
ncbi:MAG: 23S rRNA (guanosine(2251)-2'-O)-methyltransferase RlmB [Spirochaetales bacterium]|nr:23S rRNA (guanosine(2251)-2'-O)-methyltransferase RlmB [Spirochaetales bacterium]